MPNTPVNTTALYVLNLSTTPNTFWGTFALPTAPININTNEIIANIPSNLYALLNDPIAINISDTIDNATTKTVNIYT